MAAVGVTVCLLRVTMVMKTLYCSSARITPFWVYLERVHITNISASILAVFGEVEEVLWSLPEQADMHERIVRIVA